MEQRRATLDGRADRPSPGRSTAGDRDPDSPENLGGALAGRLPSLRLLRQLPLVDRGSHWSASLMEETREHLQTLADVCLAGSSAVAVGLYCQINERWRPLAQAGADEAAVQRLEHQVAGLLSQATPDSRPTDLALVTSPAVPQWALVLVLDAPLPAEVEAYLRRALSLALPLVEGDANAHCIQRARQTLLELRADLAHGLRTPLTAVSGFAQLLQRPGELEERRRLNYARIAVSEVQQAVAAIDLIVARLEAEADALGGATPAKLPSRGVESAG